MKIRESDPYKSDARYKLKDESLLALLPSWAESYAKKAKRPTTSEPKIDERFITKRSYETKCSRTRKIFSIFATLLLLPLVSKSIRRAIKGKKIVTCHTFSTRDERSSLKTSYRMEGNLFDNTLKNTRDLLIAEAYNMFKTSFDKKIKLYDENVLKHKLTQNEEEKTAFNQKNEELTKELSNLLESMLSTIQKRQTEASVASRRTLSSSSVANEIEGSINILLKTRVSKLSFEQMSEVDKKLWNLSKKAASVSFKLSPIPAIWFIALKFEHKEGFLKDLYKSFSNQEMQVALTKEGFAV